MQIQETKEKFTSWYPLYTRHVLKNNAAKATYTTLLFGLITIATYEDEECDAYDVCLCEPLNKLMKKIRGEKNIDSLDELIKEIKADRNNIKKVKFRW